MIELFLKGGLLMWPILACSVAAMALILYKVWQYRHILVQLGNPPQKVREERPPVMVPLLDALDRNLGEKEIGLIGTRLVRRLESGLGTLSLISVISPLLGLTGTVLGMIRAFQTIAEVGNRVDSSLLAGGIWMALITTASGLLVAIMAHVAFHYLDGRMSEIALCMKEMTLALSNGKVDD
jgi:biopolymer transport protein ExbB